MRREHLTHSDVAGAPAYPAEPTASTRRVAVEDRGAHAHHTTHDMTEEEIERATWAERSRIVLLPTAAPSILGLFGFAGATAMVAAWQAGWYGTATTGFVLFPFCAMIGGLAQLLAGMWSYRARDGLATAMHGIWGSFWLAFGLLFGLGAAHILPITPFGAQNQGFGFWFIMLAIITGAGFWAALGQNLGLSLVLGSLGAGSALTAIGWWLPSKGWLEIGGWLFAASAGCAIYTASALMMKESFGRVVLPLGEWKGKNVPGRVPAYPIEYREGMPGSKAGQ